MAPLDLLSGLISPCFGVVQMKINTALIFYGLFVMRSATAAQECSPLRGEVDKAKLWYYKTLVQKSLTQKVSLNTIDISQVLTENAWVALSVSTDIAEPGVFFFKNNELVDVWGGDVYPQDKTRVLNWARGIHAPDKLARCFYASVVIR